MSESLYIVIGCDADPDRAEFVASAQNDLGWKGITNGITVAKQRLASLLDDSGKAPVVTWCVRVDEQVGALAGQANYCLNEFKKLWAELESGGDEIGWHPHFWRLNDTTGQWYQEFRDVAWQVSMLRQSHASYQEAFSGRGNSVRMGWTYHNSQTMATLDALGVLVDFSALPGLQIPPQRHGSGANYFNWATSPRLPYHPARGEYRNPATKGQESLNILEVPCFVSRSLLWGAVGNLFLALKMKDIRIAWNAIRRPTYLINITGTPKYFSPLIDELQAQMKKRKPIIFATYFHADELLPNPSRLYSLENFVANVRSLHETARRMGYEVRHIRACDTPKIWQNVSAEIAG